MDFGNIYEDKICIEKAIKDSTKNAFLTCSRSFVSGSKPLSRERSTRDIFGGLEPVDLYKEYQQQ